MKLLREKEKEREREKERKLERQNTILLTLNDMNPRE